MEFPKLKGHPFLTVPYYKDDILHVRFELLPSDTETVNIVSQMLRHTTTEIKKEIHKSNHTCPVCDIPISLTKRNCIRKHMGRFQTCMGSGTQV